MQQGETEVGVRAIPEPPLEYKELVCGPAYTEHFEVVGRVMVDALDAEGMVSPRSDFLDVGCGCGRVARYLMATPLHSYAGFDRHPGMIRWCREHLAPRDRRFSFRHFDLRSVYESYDGYAGTVSATTFEFPYSDGTFDSVLIASVFTHMPLEEVRHYLAELHRVVRAAGKVLLSVFFSESVTFAEGVNFFYRPSEFLAMCEEAGFSYRARDDLAKVGYEHNWYVLTSTSLW